MRQLWLEPISDSDIAALNALCVKPEQAGYVSGIPETLEQAYGDPSWILRKICVSDEISAEGKKIVGMISMQRDEFAPDEKLWIHRMVIHHEDQGKGYGTAARCLIMLKAEQEGMDAILHAIKLDNLNMKHIIKKLGGEERERDTHSILNVKPEELYFATDIRQHSRTTESVLAQVCEKYKLYVGALSDVPGILEGSVAPAIPEDMQVPVSTVGTVFAPTKLTP